MDILEYIRSSITAAHQQTDDSMKDTSHDQLNWPTPGTANTISAIFVHLLNSEDFFVQDILQGKPRIWEQGHWDDITGVKDTPGYGGNWDGFKKMTLALEPLLAYQQAVRAATDSYLAKLTPEELDRKVEFGDGKSTVADILILLTSHTLCHAGEIAAVKGVQGTKGLPY
jgi:uncharacterized damage-inducible protein DinB